MVPVKITYTDFEPSETVSTLIESKVEKLEKIHDRITSCEVFVSAPHRHQKQKVYHIRIHLHVPGKEFEVNREPEKDYSHSDIKIAIRDAFEAMSKQVQSFVEKRRA